MRSRRERRVVGYGLVAVVAFAVAASVPSLSRGSAAAGAPSGPGCDSARPALAHYPGGVPARPQPKGGPIPCGVKIDYGAAETQMVVTRTGVLVYEPAVVPAGVGGLPQGPAPGMQTQASPGGVAISSDLGATWARVRPLNTDWQADDNGLYADPVGGHVVWTNFFVGNVASLGQQVTTGEHMMVSSDDGRTWSLAKSPCCSFLSENPRFTSGPPPSGGAAPTGYPAVLYFCYNVNVGVTSPLITYRLCSKSLDGGYTWSSPGSPLFAVAPGLYPECGASPNSFGALDGNWPQAAPDGTLYVVVQCGSSSFLARSSDEAASFSVVHTSGGRPVQLPASQEMRIDAAGNMYLAGLSGPAGLTLRVSTDRGLSWGPPLAVAAPGVTAIDKWYVMAGGAGHVAFSYLGARQGQATFDGYITETKVATAARPLLWSAMVNNPARPLLFNPPAEGASWFDWARGTIAPDGTAWGAYISDCGSGSQRDPVCDAGNVNLAALGFAGRLEWPATMSAGSSQPGGFGGSVGGASPTASRDSSSRPAPSAAASGSGHSRSGGELPFSGAPIGEGAALGAALVLLGGVLLLANRRKQS